tara:strand:- start:47 stop:220 length:174 start_codon:yes stop_codon:yes gene_type:complete
MEVPVFSRWWEVALFLLLGLLFLPFFLLLYLTVGAIIVIDTAISVIDTAWEYLKGEK